MGTSTIVRLGGPTRAGVVAQALVEQAQADDEAAAAILMAAACIEAAKAFDADEGADPVMDLERRLAMFRDVARQALATIIRCEGAAA